MSGDATQETRQGRRDLQFRGSTLTVLRKLNLRRKDWKWKKNKEDVLTQVRGNENRVKHTGGTASSTRSMKGKEATGEGDSWLLCDGKG